MKPKKIIIALVALIFVGGGLFFLQSYKQEKSLAEHHHNKYMQIAEAAKKSDSAGLLIMGNAINKYKREKGSYPKKLLELHPNYISEKKLITSLNWTYVVGKGTYQIRRGVKGGKTFAYMGPELRLKTGIVGKSDSTSMIASTVKKSPKKTKTKSSAVSKIKSTSMSIQDQQRSETRLRSGKSGIIASAPEPEKKQTILLPSKDMAVVKKELTENEKFLLTLDGNKFYIWKGNDGVIGFSDIQYPDVKQLTIYKNETWITYKENKK